MIEYQKILDKNMLNVFKDILKNIKDNGLSNNNHLYITFLTNHKNVELPIWLKQKYPEEMTIIISNPLTLSALSKLTSGKIICSLIPIE